MNAVTNPATPDPAAELVVIYTDGACKGNPGPGGWGAWLRWGAHEKELFGGEPLTTNNRMELTAVIESLALLKRRTPVAVYTDSEYVKNTNCPFLDARRIHTRPGVLPAAACRKYRSRIRRCLRGRPPSARTPHDHNHIHHHNPIGGSMFAHGPFDSPPHLA